MKENKNKFNILWIIIILVIVAAIIGFIVFRTKKGNSLDVPTGTIENLTESSKEIPSFTVLIDGLYYGVLTTEVLKEENVKVYEFDAGIDIGWGTISSHYIGVKLKDALDALQIANFDQIEFAAEGRISVTYVTEELTDDMYLVFYRDGELINETQPVNLLSVNYPYRYSVEAVTDMYFANHAVQNPEPVESTQESTESNNNNQ